MTKEQEVDKFFDAITDTHDFGDGDGRVPFVIIKGKKVRKDSLEHLIIEFTNEMPMGRDRHLLSDEAQEAIELTARKLVIDD